MPAVDPSNLSQLRPASMLRAFLHGQASGGLMLMAAAALALLVANSPLARTYFAAPGFAETPLKAY